MHRWLSREDGSRPRFGSDSLKRNRTREHFPYWPNGHVVHLNFEKVNIVTRGGRDAPLAPVTPRLPTFLSYQLYSLSLDERAQWHTWRRETFDFDRGEQGEHSGESRHRSRLSRGMADEDKQDFKQLFQRRLPQYIAASAGSPLTNLINYPLSVEAFLSCGLLRREWSAHVREV